MKRIEAPEASIECRSRHCSYGVEILLSHVTRATVQPRLRQNLPMTKLSPHVPYILPNCRLLLTGSPAVSRRLMNADKLHVVTH